MKKSLMTVMIVFLVFILSCGGFYTYEMLVKEGEYKLADIEALKDPVWVESKEIVREGFIVVVAELNCAIQGAESGELSTQNLEVRQTVIKQWSKIDKIDKAVLDLANNYGIQKLTEYEKNDTMDKFRSDPDDLFRFYRIYKFQQIK